MNEDSAGQNIPRRARRRLLTTLMMSTALCLGAFPTVLPISQAAAQMARTHNFNISSQPLSQALRALANQTGVQIAYQTSIAAGATAPAVSGTMSTEQALARMLSGSGLGYSFTNANTVTILGATASGVNGIAADGATVLDTIVVQGANPNSTMALPEAYAGGQVATGGQVGMLGNRDVMDTPFSQTSYTNKTIQDQQARTLVDVLANEPSIVTTTRGGGDNDFAIYRGFPTQSYTASNGLNGLSGMAPSQFPSTDYIERVEVLRGPGALLKGASLARHGGIGGTVNLVTKKADDEPLTQLTTRYMSDTQLGAHVDFGRRFGTNKEFGIRFNGSLDGGDTSVDTQQSKFGTAALNLDYRGDRVRISADIAHQSQSLQSPKNSILLPVVPGVLTSLTRIPDAPDPSTPLSPSWGKTEHEITLGMIQGEVDISDNITAYAAIGAQQYDANSNVDIVDLLDGDGAISLRPSAWRDRNKIVSMQAGTRATVETGPVSHAIGFNLSRLQWDYATAGCRACSGSGAFNPVGTIYDPDFPSAPITVDPGSPQPASKVTASSVAIADTMSILDDRIQFTAGVRYQQVESENLNPYYAVLGNAKTAAWSPSFGLVVKPFENVSLYGSYIENLEPGSTVGSTYSNAGEVFPPYSSTQYEVGIKVDWGRVTTTLAAFQIAQPSTIAVADTAGGLPTLTLDGEQRNRGIELTAYGEVFDGVRLLGGVTFLDAVRTKTANGTYDGARAAAAPRFRAVVGAEWDTPFVEGLTLTGRLTYTGDTVVANRRPDLTVPAWTQVDLGARYTFVSSWNAKPVTVNFGVDNVFNERYWKVGHVAGNLFKSDPRTFRLSTTFNF